MRARLSALLTALVLAGCGYARQDTGEREEPLAAGDGDGDAYSDVEKTVDDLGFTAATADPPPPPRVGGRTHVEILGIIFVAEAGWDYPADHALIAHMFRRRAKYLRDADGYPWTFIAMAMKYSRGTWISKRSRGLWLRGMREGCDVPELWPYHRSRWERYYAHRCLAVMDRARSFLRNAASLEEPSCTATVWHFGFERDKPKPGQIRIDCDGDLNPNGETKNIYYTVRRYKAPAAD